MADPDAILFDDDLLCWTDVEHEDIENSGDDDSEDQGTTALDAADNALKECSPDEPRRFELLQNLATALVNVWSRTDNEETLLRLLHVLREQLNLYTEDHPAFWTTVGHLIFYLSFFDFQSNEALGEDALATLSKVITPAAHLDKDISANYLDLLQQEITRTHKVELIREAIELARRSVDASLEWRDKQLALFTLAELLVKLHRVTGDVNAFEEADALRQQVAEAVEPSKPLVVLNSARRAEIEAELELTYQNLVEKSQAHRDSSTKVDKGHAWVALSRWKTRHVWSTDDWKKQRAMHNDDKVPVSNLTSRSAAVDLDAVAAQELDHNLSLHHAAVETAKSLVESSSNRAARSEAKMSLAATLFLRSKLLDDKDALTDLNQAIQLIMEASMDSKVYYREDLRAILLMNRSDVLRECYARGGNPEMLSLAAELLRDPILVTERWADPRSRVASVYELGTCLIDLYSALGDVDSLQEGVAYIEELANSRADLQVSTAGMLDDLALRLRKVSNDTAHGQLKFHLTDQPVMLITCGSAVKLLRRNTVYDFDDPWIALSTLWGMKDLGINCAVVALCQHKPEDAIELLEGARALLWTQALRLRTPSQAAPADDIDRLALFFGAVGPDLTARIVLDHQVLSTSDEAHRFAKQRPLSDEVDHIMKRYPSDSNPAEMDRIDHRDTAGARTAAEAVIASITRSSRLDFDRFLPILNFQALALAAASGHVVTLISHQRLCEAVVLLAPHGTVKRVALPRLTMDDIEKLAIRVKREHLRSRGFMRGASRLRKPPSSSADLVNLLNDDYGGAQRASKIKRPITNVLEYLWERIVHPVVVALQLKKDMGRGRPRLHWCPLGAFASLPLHAATSANKGGHGSSDYFVSSYTPTITSLLNARRGKCTLTPAGCRALLVAVGDAPGLEPLAQANTEVEVVQHALPTAVETIVFGNMANATGPATSPAISSYIKPSAILHLACHGEQNLWDPLESGFALRDGWIKVSKLLAVKLESAFLAFLSACETAKGDTAQPDEAVHLAATMLFAGFRSVIATMWSMHDVDGPFVAREFYSELAKKAEWDTDDIPYALDLAVQKLRGQGVAPHRWAPYIHMGA